MSSNVDDLKLDKPLYEYCKNATNKEGDTFVGIKSEIIEGKHNLTIYFPIGYRISRDDMLVRTEVLQLLSVLQDYNDEQSRVSSISPEQLLKTVRFPAQAYICVIADYINNGYYKMSEDEFKPGTSGPISWNKTRGKIKPYVTGDGFVYPGYIIRQHGETDKALITEISRYCVYESFIKLGWLYKMPNVPQPNVTRTITEYKHYLSNKKLTATKDRDKQLFQAMLDILDFTNQNEDPEEFYFGTNRFEYIWERVIEATYGNEKKEEYFPRTTWRLNIGQNRDNKALEPDTVMSHNKNIYVLDAKYYKYGVTKNPYHLPESSSINKQISYGEYIQTHDKFEDKRKDGMNVYNAFLMPYDSTDKPFNMKDSKYYSVGEGIAEWKDNLEDYHRVQGILIDVKHLISNSTKPNHKEIEKLSREILESLEKNKGN